MNDTSIPGTAPAMEAARGGPRILVWDVPVRVFHWLFALSFAGAYITAETDQWRLVHVTLGYTAAALAVFRIVWGVAGTRYARFSSFVRGPRAVAGYLGSLWRGKPQHFVGHNPAGALTVVALLLLALALGVTGWATYSAGDGGAWEEVHEVIANLMLVVVIAHIAGVIVSSWLHHENLIGAMFTGNKRGDPSQGISRRWRGLGVLLLVAVALFWWWQPRHPDAGVAQPTAAQGGHAGAEPGN